MTVRRWIGTLALGVAMGLPSTGFAQASTDASITTKIKADFVNEKSLKGSDINVDTTDHVVTLKGTVASTAGKTRAAQIARHTKGVTKVVDNLTIAPEKETGTTGTMKKAEEKTKDAAGATGEAIDDGWITTKIKADFVNEDALKGSDINVDTNKHVVTLKGTVASLAGKTRAQDIAKTTKGVNRVINELTIAPKK